MKCTTHVFKSLKVVKERKNWTEARTHCEEIGGKLFSDLDGSLAQLNILFELQNNLWFWLGLELTGIGRIVSIRTISITFGEVNLVLNAHILNQIKKLIFSEKTSFNPKVASAMHVGSPVISPE